MSLDTAAKVDIDDHADEIRGAVAQGRLKPALRRLHDFAADFGTRQHRNDVVLVDGRFSALTRDIRNLGETEGSRAERNAINGAVLELLDEIGDCALREAAAAEQTPAREPVGEREKPAETAPMRKRGKPPGKSRRSGLRVVPLREEPEPEPTPVFSCQDLGKRFGAFSLSEVTLDLRPGEITGLVGINGSGKSTLLRIIVGELAPSTGKRSYPALADRLDWPKIRRQIAYVPQAPPRWYGCLEDSLRYVAAEQGITGKRNHEEVERILYRLTLDEFRNHSWNQISGGYKMRFELARALLSDPRLLVLDEPLAPLDIVTQQLFLDDLRNLANARKNPIPVIMSSQHLHEVEAVSDQILFLDGGKAKFCGSPDRLGELFTDHLFELRAPNADQEKIEHVLGALPDLSVETFGQNLNVYVAAEVTGAAVLRRLIDADIEIVHFRDVSRSTRRLFDSRGGEL